MAAIVGPGGPSMATKFAIDGPGGDHLRRDRPLKFIPSVPLACLKFIKKVVMATILPYIAFSFAATM